jgi:signal peptidase
MDTKQIVGLSILLVVLAPFVVFTVPSVVGASHSYVVLSSSMSPTIHAGDVVFVSDVDPENIEERDVITFAPEEGPLSERNKVITHRVVDIEQQSDGRHFVTKGDANDSPDSFPVAAENVVGRVTFQLPLIGHVIAFAGSRLGMLLLIVLPAGLLGVLEIRDMLEGASEDGSTTE